MSAAGSAPDIERTLRDQGEAIAALQELLDEPLPGLDLKAGESGFQLHHCIDQLQDQQGLPVLVQVSLGNAGLDARLDSPADRQGVRNLGVCELRDCCQVRGLVVSLAIGHHKAPHVARAATRYVAAAISLPSRWLQRKAWVRRAAATDARPSDTSRVVPGPENSHRVPAPGTTDGGAR